MEEINKIIGNNLTFLRKKNKLTQAEIAEKFNYSYKTISKWECGDSLPSVEVLFKVAQFYGVTLNDLTNSDLSQTFTPQKEREGLKAQNKWTIITLLAITAVWACAIIVFVALKLSINIYYVNALIWALPASCIVLIVFTSIWGKFPLLHFVLSFSIWALIAALYFQFISHNLWQIFIIGIPLQIAVVLWGCLDAKSTKRKMDDLNKTESKIAGENKEDDKTKLVE